MAGAVAVPIEIALLVLEQVQDLKSLDALRRTSGSFAEGFRMIGAKLVSNLMTSSLDKRLMREMAVYAQIIARRLHKPKAKEPTEEEIKVLYTHRELAGDMSPVLISHLLHTFSAVASHTDAILYKCLNDFRDLPHEHLADKHFFYTRPGLPSRCYIPEIGQAYHVREPRPLDWDEQQRMLIAVWRAVNHRLLGRPTTLPSFNPPSSRKLVQLWMKMDHRVDAFEFAVGCLESVDARPSEFPILWHALPSLPAEMTTTTERAWNLDRDGMRSGLAFPGPGYSFFRLNRANLRHSPLRGAEWKHLRRFGLGIWNLRRLVEELELENGPRELSPPRNGRHYQPEIDAHLSMDDLAFTWKQLYDAGVPDEEEKLPPMPTAVWMALPGRKGLHMVMPQRTRWKAI